MHTLHFIVSYHCSSVGYEKYNSMRADATLSFLERVGMPDAKAIAAEQRGTDMLADGGDGYVTVKAIFIRNVNDDIGG